MPKIVISMPKIGESTQIATILSWYKKEGESIAKDELLVEISTDKVNSELPCEYEGILTKILVKENEQVAVYKPIAELEVREEVAQKYAKEHSAHVENVAVQSTHISQELFAEKTYNNAFLSPVVRKLIAEHSLSFEDLKQIPSHNRRITKKDIEQFIESKKTKSNTQALNLEPKMQLKIAENDSVQTLSHLRKTIADTLQFSYQTIPHVTTFSEIQVTKLVNYREQEKERFLKEYNQKITYTHVLMYCVVQSLKAFPQLNAWMNVDELVLKGSINLGFAAALPDGNLIVPNVKNVEKLNFVELVTHVNTIAKNAKENKLAANDIQETTFTVSNTGIFGSLMGTPIIVRPQVAVLALGEIHSGIDLDENDTVIRIQKMYASISYDHRVVDGALASKFITHFKQLVQNFDGKSLEL